MDSANVSFLKLTLDQDYFFEYQVDQYEQVGVPTKSLLNVLKCANSTDYLEINIKDQKINILFENKDGNRTSEFSISGLEILSPDLSPPEYDGVYKITMNSKELDKICRDLTQFGDTLSFDIKNESEINIITEDDQGSSNAKITLKKGNGISIFHNDEDSEETDVEMSLSLKYMCTFTKCNNLAEKTNLHLTNTHPFKLEYVLYSLKDKKNVDAPPTGSIIYYLAPKLKDDEVV